MIAYLESLISENKEVILMIDMNESTKQQGGLTSQLKQLGICEVNFHNENTEITTFKHGNTSCAHRLPYHRSSLFF